MPIVFTAEVNADFGGTPLVAVVAPPAEYVGDDDSDLVSYPAPTLDEFGRPEPGDEVP